MILDDFFTTDSIIKYLCDLRAKKAKQRNEKHLLHLLSEKENLNHHKFQTEEEIFLKKILPSRRKWIKLGKKRRYKNQIQRINSFDLNSKAIYLTTQYYLVHHPNEPFVKALKEFLNQVRNRLNDPDYLISSPRIYPQHKKPDKKSNECRPIAIYSIIDKLIISKTNSYITKLADSEFYHASYAFRSTRIVNNKQVQVNHHNAIKDIINYRKKYKGKRLFVAECDMSKFYDSVSHTIIKKEFKKLVKRLSTRGIQMDSRAYKVFYAYLKSYNFVKDVLPLNNDVNFWTNQNFTKNCYFEWVQTDLLVQGHFKRINHAKIGIPQGGALSGFIANLVIDYADKKILNLKDKNLLYIRFCDDMIMCHPYKYCCEKAISTYENALLNLKLIPHEFQHMHENNFSSFWNKKSKNPFIWSSDHKSQKNFPWIGFVGYEIHYSGKIRIRKSSLKKETKKQKKVIKRIINIVDSKNIKKRKGTIMESAIHRLIGMSVGRIKMWNYDKIENEMCWVNGFPELKDNKFVRRQLKRLDHHRNYQINVLKKHLRGFDEKKPKSESNNKIEYYGKPFSYFKHVLKK